MDRGFIEKRGSVDSQSDNIPSTDTLCAILSYLHSVINMKLGNGYIKQAYKYTNIWNELYDQYVVSRDVRFM